MKDDKSYDYYIAYELSDFFRNNLRKSCVLGEEFAKYFENITIPAQKYAIFETERSNFPTTVFTELRKRIVTEWLPNSGYQIANAPEIAVTHWYQGENSKNRYIELWIPVESIK